MQDIKIEPTSANENVLTTLPERLMAMTATARSTKNYYGPGPADMVLQKPELPETVKGVLAQYIS